jgi:hypothetical protein
VREDMVANELSKNSGVSRTLAGHVTTSSDRHAASTRPLGPP